ncbi:MAG: hypothetical protein ABI569_12695 [Casimicrobiaceae bacterium]
MRSRFTAGRTTRRLAAAVDQKCVRRVPRQDRRRLRGVQGDDFGKRIGDCASRRGDRDTPAKRTCATRARIVERRRRFEIVAGRRDGKIPHIEKLNGATWRRRIAHVHRCPSISAEDAQIAARVDATGRDAGGAHCGDSLVHRIAFGDAAEIERDRDVGTDAEIALQVERIRGAARRASGDGDVEPAAGLAPQGERKFEDGKRIRIDDHRLSMRLSGDTRKVALRVVRTHFRVDMGDRVEASGKARLCRLVRGQRDLDEGPERDPRARGHVFSGSGGSHRWREGAARRR